MGRQERARAPPDPQDAAQGRSEQAARLTDSASGALVCAANISEGRDQAVLGRLRSAAGELLLDVHCDADHHRSVLTMAGAPTALVGAVLAVAEAAVASISLTAHRGVHPRTGAVDVVPFAPLVGDSLDAAISAREAVLEGLARLGVPGFRFGPLPDGSVRTLPEIRRGAFAPLAPDAGPPAPHPTAGATAVGARGPLVAWNIWLHGATLEASRRIAASVRRAEVRALGLQVGGATQVSCNLLDPAAVTPQAVFELVEAALPGGAHVVRCELVGLVPDAVLDAVPEAWWERLDLSSERSLEAAAARIGLVRG